MHIVKGDQSRYLQIPKFDYYVLVSIFLTHFSTHAKSTTCTKRDLPARSFEMCSKFARTGGHRHSNALILMKIERLQVGEWRVSGAIRTRFLQGVQLFDCLDFCHNQQVFMLDIGVLRQAADVHQGHSNASTFMKIGAQQEDK